MAALLVLAQNNGAVAGLGFGIVGLVLLGVFLFLSIFWLWMLIDCLLSSLPAVEKVVWLLVIFFLHILGAALYFFLARGKRGRAV
jgi:hypothetical protein